MNRRTFAISSLIFVLSVLIIILGACSSQSPSSTSTDTIPTASATLQDAVSAGTEATATCPPCTSDETSQSADSSGGGADKASDVQEVADVVASRTPVPTPTPGVIDQSINEFTNKVGLSGTTFLGLSIGDWINILVSVILVVLIYYLGFWLFVVGIKWLVKRFNWDLDKDFLDSIEKETKGLIAVIAIRFGLLQLNFIQEGLRTLVDDISFVLALLFIAIILIRIVDFSVKRYKQKFVSEENKRSITPLLITIQRIIDVVVLVALGSIGLSHFGINVNGMMAVLIIVGGIFVYGARNVIQDAISGFIILLDQPFRIGDSIEIEDVGTWGEVIDIGTRTTRIRTGDNREIIIPNSQISSGQIINYSYPDPKYRAETKIGVAYGTDLSLIRQIIEKTVYSVEDVLQDKPVSVQFYEFGGTTRNLRIQWWVGSRRLKDKTVDKVNEALEKAMDDAGIDMPFDTYNVNVEMKTHKDQE